MPPGHSVLVLGSGLAGLLQVAAAPTSGAGFVAATDVVGPRLEAARRLGAAAWNASEDVGAKLRERLGRLADLVVVCTSAPGVLDQAFSSVERGGTVLLFALPDPGTTHTLDMHSLWKDGVRIISSYAGNRADHIAALELIASGRLDVASLVTHRLPLGRTAEGFGLVAEAGDALKVIIEPQA
jgi:L-iditol 2-dehydrogenase